MIGTSLSHYRILEQLGAGGMGVVYRARDEKLERDVAVKVLPPGTLPTEDARRRFRNEALALSRLNHPNIATIYDFGADRGTEYLVMELVSGEPLDKRLAAGPLPDYEVLNIGTQLAEGLAAAHEQGVLHRDLKPSNLRQRSDGLLKILDFGLAKSVLSHGEAAPTQSLPATRGLVGTVPYMAPEQLRGEPATESSDIYSAGAVLYEVATGRRPFVEHTDALLIESILNHQPPAPRVISRHISPELENILLKALSKDRGRRYSSAREFHLALRAAQQRTAGAASITSRRRSLLALGAIVVLLLAAVLLWFRFSPARLGPSENVPLAVLPFRLLANDPESDFLRVGIADAITTKLSTLARLRPRPTNAVLRYESADPREAGRALAVEYVLAGTVQRSGERFRVTTQLVRVSDGGLVWGDHYDLARSDLLGLEDSIATRITEALGVQISSAERGRLYRRYTAKADAYEHYLKGRTYIAISKKEPTLDAVREFEMALKQDPDYALAHAGLAMASAVMRIRFASEKEFKQWEERAHGEAKRALELDPTLAEAHEALAAVYRNTEFDWDRTIEESGRALTLNPSLEFPHYYRATAFYHLGLLDQTEAEVQAGVAINPTNRVEPARVLAATALFNGDYEKARRLLMEVRSPGSGPVSDWYLAQAMYYAGDQAGGEQLLSQLAGSAQAEQRGRATLGSFLAADGKAAEARQQLAKVHADTYMDHHVAYSLGVAYAQLGQVDEARKWLARAADSGFPCYPWFEHDPLLANARRSPQYVDFFSDLRRRWATAKDRYPVTVTRP